MLVCSRDVGAADRDLLSACSVAIADVVWSAGDGAAPNSLGGCCEVDTVVDTCFTVEDDDDAASFFAARPRDSSRLGRLDWEFGSGDRVLRLAALEWDLPLCSSEGFSLTLRDFASALSLFMHSSMRLLNASMSNTSYGSRSAVITVMVSTTVACRFSTV